MAEGSGYWQQVLRRRLSRRSLLGGTAMGLVGISGSALLACGSSIKPTPTAGNAATGSIGQPRPGGTFNTYVQNNLSSLDPHQSASSASGAAIGQAYAGLFRYKISSDPQTTLNLISENNLATSIESPDALTWTVKLRTDAVFHNIAPVSGHPVTSEDVKATIQRAFASRTNTMISLISMIDPNQITTPDAGTVVFKLKNLFGPFHGTLTGGASGIMPKEAYAGVYDPAKLVIGSGAFMWDSYTPDVALNLKRFPNWYETGRPYIDGIKTSIVPDPSQELAQFTAGHLDTHHPDPASLAAAQQQNPKATVLGVPAGRAFVFVGHMDHPNGPYANINVRRALSMALDRKTMAKAIYGKNYSDNGVLPAALGTSALPPEKLGSATQWYTYNPAEARKLIDATPAARQLNRLVYPTKVYGAQFETLMQTVVSMLSAVGLQIQAVPIDYSAEFINGGKGVLYGNYDDSTMYGSNQGVHVDASTTLIYNFQSGNDHNLPKVSDPAVDAMLANMNTLLDDAAHMKAILDIQLYAADKVWQIPLPSEYTYTLVQPWVSNYQYGGATAAGGENQTTLNRAWLTRSA